MKTDDLIAMLAKDSAPVSKRRVAGRLVAMCAAGALVAFGALMVWLGVRPDLMAALHTGPYWMKTVYTLGLATGGFALIERLSRPGARGRTGAVLVALFLIAIVGMAMMQLMRTPPDARMAAMMGSSWTKCPWRILALALPVLAAVLYGVRQLAPTRLTLAGATSGLLAGGIAATVYGLYCEETAAPFVAIWYTLGMGLSAAVGALLGRRVLAW